MKAPVNIAFNVTRVTGTAVTYVNGVSLSFMSVAIARLMSTVVRSSFRVINKISTVCRRLCTRSSFLRL